MQQDREFSRGASGPARVGSLGKSRTDVSPETRTFRSLPSGSTHEPRRTSSTAQGADRERKREPQSSRTWRNSDLEGSTPQLVQQEDDRARDERRLRRSESHRRAREREAEAEEFREHRDGGAGAASREQGRSQWKADKSFSKSNPEMFGIPKEDFGRASSFGRPASYGTKDRDHDDFSRSASGPGSSSHRNMSPHRSGPISASKAPWNNEEEDPDDVDVYLSSLQGTKRRQGEKRGPTKDLNMRDRGRESGHRDREAEDARIKDRSSSREEAAEDLNDVERVRNRRLHRSTSDKAPPSAGLPNTPVNRPPERVRSSSSRSMATAARMWEGPPQSPASPVSPSSPTGPNIVPKTAESRVESDSRDIGVTVTAEEIRKAVDHGLQVVVQLHDLVNATHLNGRTGIANDTAGEKVLVEIEPGKMVKVQPRNVEILAVRKPKKPVEKPPAEDHHEKEEHHAGTAGPIDSEKQASIATWVNQGQWNERSSSNAARRSEKRESRREGRAAAGPKSSPVVSDEGDEHGTNAPGSPYKSIPHMSPVGAGAGGEVELKTAIRPDLYTLLELPRNATRKDVKESFRALDVLFPTFVSLAEEAQACRGNHQRKCGLSI
mmetsp:Transcript_26638/g.41674  ORF Transcript_26638/g.41674 Transcript_26638/m.41674 type:complete len:608 (-) Transcript_26638:1423-3246(-)